MYSNMPEMVALNATGGDTYCHENTWIGKIVSQDIFPSLDLVRSIGDQYIVSLYWATATLVCVGYGDIHASMQSEMFMATVVMICGTIYYSSILGDISANIQTDDIRRGHYKGRLSDIMKFFKVYDVSKDTQRQVKHLVAFSVCLSADLWHWSPHGIELQPFYLNPPATLGCKLQYKWKVEIGVQTFHWCFATLHR